MYVYLYVDIMQSNANNYYVNVCKCYLAPAIAIYCWYSWLPIK